MKQKYSLFAALPIAASVGYFYLDLPLVSIAGTLLVGMLLAPLLELRWLIGINRARRAQALLEVLFPFLILVLVLKIEVLGLLGIDLRSSSMIAPFLFTLLLMGAALADKAWQPLLKKVPSLVARQYDPAMADRAMRDFRRTEGNDLTGIFEVIAALRADDLHCSKAEALEAATNALMKGTLSHWEYESSIEGLLEAPGSEDALAAAG